MDSKKTKQDPGKVATAFGALIILGGVALVIWGAIALFGMVFGGHKTTAPKASTVSKTVAKTTTKPAATTPTVSLATLNSQAVATLTPVLTDLSNQMAQGQAYTKQSDAMTIGGAFNNWSQAEQHDQNVKNNNNVTAAYNKADNAYYDGHQTVPTALDDWNSDAQSVISDITEWANAQETVYADQVSGDPALSSDQQTADKYYKQFTSDLARAQADISKI